MDLKTKKFAIGAALLALATTLMLVSSPRNALAAEASHQSTMPTADNAQTMSPTDDDLFPWPWGTECPFPWEEIKGRYMVKAKVGVPYNGHFIEFDVKRDPKQPGLEFLDIRESDADKVLYAHGKGYSQKDARIVRGVLKQETTGREYIVMVRTYRRDENASCRPGDLVTAITFCPLRGRKCITDSNYLLVNTED